jgi:hypothetical protein
MPRFSMPLAHTITCTAVTSSRFYPQEYGICPACPPADALTLLACRMVGRELQRWAPDTNLDLDDTFSLDDGGSRGWDQFALNEAKFGVTTNYREEFYTTELDPRWV